MIVNENLFTHDGGAIFGLARWCHTQSPLLGVHCNWDLVLPRQLTDELCLAPSLNEMLSRRRTDVADTDSAKASHIYQRTDVARPPVIS